MRDVDDNELCQMFREGIPQMLQKHGKSGYVSKKEDFGSCLTILANRKEGIVGSVLRTNKQKLLNSGEEEE
jgi:hypothetical protein